jgi:hypothetical protein
MGSIQKQIAMMRAKTPRNSPIGLGIAILVSLLLFGCGPADTYRSQMNPRKQKIYDYASTLGTVDKESAVMGAGGGPSHPSKLKEPYPSQGEMEAAIGKADYSQFEKVSDLHPLGGKGQFLTIYWWENDSTWEVPGLHKKGFREIIVARFDADGRLRMLEVLEPVGYELIGRHSSEWHWIG